MGILRHFHVVYDVRVLDLKAGIELKIEEADVKDDVRVASKWRGISIYGHITPFSRRL